MFLGKNYDDVTMDGIAEAAGVTKGALYHHFQTKEALYLAMMHTDLEEKQALLRGAVLSQGTCRERLRGLTKTFLELPPDRRELIKLVRRDINIFRDPNRAKLVRAYQAALPEQIELILHDGMGSGELARGDPRLLSWAYVALVEVLLTRYAGQALGSQAKTLDYVLDLFFHGAGETPNGEARMD